MHYKYYVYGLQVASELELPELIASNFATTDVTITFGETPKKLDNCLKKGVTYEVNQNEFLFEIFDVARFHIANGNTITISPKEEEQPDDIRLFLLGTCFGALLHQRQILPIHASAIEHEGAAVLFMGASGAGKSTTGSAFRMKGYNSITDDVCPVKIIDGIPYAVSGYPQSKLCEDAMEQLAIDVNAYQLVREGIGKRAVRYKENFATAPMKIKACYFIQIEKNVELPRLETLINTDAFIALKINIYRKHIAEAMKLQFHILTTLSSLANQSNIKKIIRDETSDINDLVTLIETDLNSMP